MVVKGEVTVHEKVRQLLSRGVWLAPHEVRDQLIPLGTWISEAAATSRIRDLKKAQFGRHRVAKQRREGTTYWEYMVITVAERKAA